MESCRHYLEGPSAGISAEEIVNDWPEEEIARILRDYGEEKHWRLLARRICERRVEAPITTTKASRYDI